MKTLSNQEKMILHFLEPKMISDGTVIETDAVNYLMKLPYDILINICNQSSQLNDFMHSASIMLSVIAKKLKSLNYIYVPIQSMDGKEQHDVFDHYLAALITQSYFINLPAARRSVKAKQFCSTMLDKACELGLYNALIIRCKQTIKKATIPGLSLVARQEIASFLTVDIRRLAHLYWSMGYLQAGSLWQEIGNYFVKEENRNEEEKNYGVALHDEAVKYFLCASLLRQHPLSRNILNALTQGRGVSSLSCEEGLYFETWEDFQSMIYHWISGEQYEKILHLAEEEIASILSLTENSKTECKKAA